jgi:nitrite reductase/ring-hydroxylating ferredoxin subunit
VSGSTVVCPLHAYKLCLDTGSVVKPDVCIRVDTFPVRVENGVILVSLDSAEEKAA